MLTTPAGGPQDVLKRTSVTSLRRIKENRFEPFLVGTESKSIQNTLTSKPSHDCFSRVLSAGHIDRAYRWFWLLPFLLNQKTLIFASNPVYSLEPFVVLLARLVLLLSCTSQFFHTLLSTCPPCSSHGEGRRAQSPLIHPFFSPVQVSTRAPRHTRWPCGYSPASSC